jgi:hypothetical protein
LRGGSFAPAPGAAANHSNPPLYVIFTQANRILPQKASRRKRRALNYGFAGECGLFPR